MVNHGWRHMMARCGWDFSQRTAYRATAWVVTFIAVVFSWVYFRAPTLEHGNQIVFAMLGLSGFEILAGILARLGTIGTQLTAMGFAPVQGGGAAIVSNYLWILIVAPIALVLPNVAQISCQYEPVLYENDNTFRDIRGSRLMSWDYNSRWVVAIALAGVAGILTLQQVSEFLYFQF
jgi:alginate O-acetyltransferase complex protein AlgI